MSKRSVYIQVELLALKEYVILISGNAIEAERLFFFCTLVSIFLTRRREMEKIYGPRYGVRSNR